MNKIRKFNIPTIQLGEDKILFVPLEKDGVENTIGFFIKNYGTFKEVTFDNLAEAVDISKPLFAIRFKHKKDINALIKFLRYYRENIFSKEDKTKVKQ